MFESIFTKSAEGGFLAEPLLVLAAAAASVILGFIIAMVYMKTTPTTRSFAITLTVLPMTVQAVIMAVNGNLGYGVAVLGAFGLVRFRSAAGSSREICAIFLAMAVGLINSMGYIGYSAGLVASVCIIMLVLEKAGFGDKSGDSRKDLKITIPENLDYTGIFDDIFSTYTKRHRLERVKTTNLGSLFELHYVIELKNPADEKKFIDEIRCRNGNLTVMISRFAPAKDEL